MSESEMQAELERLRAENAQLKSKDKGGLSLKVSDPVSAPEIEAFIRENASKLKTKG